MKCPHCGGEIDADLNGTAIVAPHDDTSQEIKALWNRLARRENLPIITTVSPTRLVHWRCRRKERVHFWSELCDAVGRRGAWARQRRLPTFDQAVSPSFLAKLLEGNYDGDPDEEREGLIQKIHGKKFGKVMATIEGLEGGVGVEKWAEISTERLRSMAAVQIANESF